MPMYDFACRGCGQPFERKLRMSQVGEPQACPECGSEDTYRSFTTAVSIGGISHGRTAVSAPPVSSPFT